MGSCAMGLGAPGVRKPHGITLYGAECLAEPLWGHPLQGWGLMKTGTPMDPHFMGPGGSQEPNTVAL